MKHTGKNKWISYAAIIGIGGVLLCTACGKKNNEAVTKQAETKNVETTVSSQNEVQETAPAGNSFEEYSSYPYMSEEYTFYYINSGKLEFPDFTKAIQKLQADLSKANNQTMYVYDAGWGGDDTYKKSPQVTSYIYVGEVKDDQPHGVGTVYCEYNWLDRGEQGPDCVYLKCIEGYFEKGKCNGFGIKYKPSLEDGDLQRINMEIDRLTQYDYETCTRLYYDPVTYIGEYKNGEQKGTGIKFKFPEESDNDYITGRYNMQDYTISTGDFKKGDLVKGRIYLHEHLLYNGELKDGKRTGKGQLYYRNRDELAFDGKFKDDDVLEGTMYDLDGTVLAEGKWTNDLCGMTEFYPTYREKSKYGDRDYLEEMGEDYEYSPLLQSVVKEGNKVQESIEAEKYGITDTDSEDYIIPDSDRRFLTEDELSELDASTLRLARNEIYAKHGRKFQTEDLNQYFSQKSWYDGYLSAEEFDDSVLNEYEKENLTLIKQVEAKKGE